MHHFVLVIDDDRDRDEIYRHFFESYMRKNSVVITPVFVENPEKLYDELISLPFSAIISDVILEKTVEWKKISLFDMFHFLSKRHFKIPILLVSKEWDDTNFEEVSSLFEFDFFSNILQWKMFEKEKLDEYLENTFTLAINKYLKKSNAFSTLQKIDNEIIILHLSDLHFGFSDDQLAEDSLFAITTLVRTKFGENAPHFLAITGDITEHGLPSEFTHAKKWIQELQSLLSNPFTMIVPGNHDFCVPLSCATNIAIEESVGKFTADIINADLCNYSAYPFLDFSSSVSDVAFQCNDANDMYWFVDYFLTKGILFHGFNSSYQVRPTAVPAPAFSKIAISNIARSSLKFSRLCSHLFVVGMTHHCPFACFTDGMDESSMTSYGKYYGIPGTVKSNIFLCGHRHTHGFKTEDFTDFYTLVSRAPSPLKEVAGHTRGLNILRIYKNHSLNFNAVSSYRLCFEDSIPRIFKLKDYDF
ncbi:hypothetical protein DVDV_2038 [Desulfovibrio sp. DV]|uniref:metallophosphoesterase family protein n=1 Tax=Desulfovibrio sp. DV TaxID=1844708 RepID=UPI00094B8B8C|nr:metallophosphoesterase [Desulfovibrio sp. DV]OLN27624.1 hypothetical protein DVDV_2038 [Desulfovibrio sp. DV]